MGARATGIPPILAGSNVLITLRIINVCLLTTIVYLELFYV
jgi:hypothetical protein